MNAIEKVLSGIEQGNTIDNLARELDMNISTLLAMIDFLVDEKYLEILKIHCSCSGLDCGRGDCNSGSRLYTITSKGLQIIS